MNLLLDENLSPSVGRELRSEGVDIVHVLERGMLGGSDSEVLEKAFIEDRILVTCNVKDFEKLGHAWEIHAGIVLIEQGDLLRDEQLDVLRRVIERLKQERDMVNRVLRVAEDGSMSMEEIPLPE